MSFAGWCTTQVSQKKVCYAWGMKFYYFQGSSFSLSVSFHSSQRRLWMQKLLLYICVCEIICKLLFCDNFEAID